MNIGRLGIHRVMPGDTLPGQYHELALCDYVHEVTVPRKQWSSFEETFGDIPTVTYREVVPALCDSKRKNVNRRILGRYSGQCLGKYSGSLMKVSNLGRINQFMDVYEPVIDMKPVWLITWRK